MEAEPIVRLYSGISDSKMLTEAQTICDILVDDLADFTAKDPAFTVAFTDDLQAKIDAAKDVKTDEAVSDEIGALTQNLLEAWEDCKVFFQDMKYYIEQAFPGKPKVHDQFGFDNYREMSRQQGKVSNFMKQLNDMAQEHSVTLQAVGFTLAQIGQINTLREAFETAERAQEKAKKNRPVETVERVDAYNEVWRILQRVNRLSKLVYRGSYAKLQQYLLPAPGTNEREFLALTGTIFNAADDTPIEGATVELPALSLTATTDENGKYGFTQELPAGATAIRVSAAGFVTSEGFVTLIDNELVERDVRLTAV